MHGLADLSPDVFAAELLRWGCARAWLLLDPESGRFRASDPRLDELARSASELTDFDEHEAVFLAVGPATGALFGVFLHRTIRGQGQGGLRNWPYACMGDFLCDGLRLSRGMSRKSALAGLWWGGGKGLIGRPAGGDRESTFRRALYQEYGEFVTSLGGCYVTAEDVGTSSVDIGEVFGRTRFATGLPARLGGSGNPSPHTAAGVLCALEAALDFLGLGSLEGKRIAMQGTGNVGAGMIEGLLEREVASIVATDISPERRDAIQDRFDGRPVEVRLVDPEDHDILGEPCDVLCPNALGGVLGPETIPKVEARVVCGAANNPLLQDERDARALLSRGITYVPDFVANRMGIVQCANEQYGRVNGDPAVAAHLSRSGDSSIYATTIRILETSRRLGISTVEVANRLADARIVLPHPIWGHRSRRIVHSLVESRWHQRDRV